MPTWGDADELIDKIAGGYLDFDEPVMMAAAEIGAPLAEVYDQDVENLPWVQKGLRTLPAGVAFSNFFAAFSLRADDLSPLVEGVGRPYALGVASGGTF